VLAKIGEQNAITINQDEVNRALAARAQQFPGQEKQVIEFYTSNPQAMAEIRVPLFEDKVIDFLGELVEVKDRKVSRQILFLDPDDAAEKLTEAETPAEETKPAKKAKTKDESKPKAKSGEKASAKTEENASAKSEEKASAKSEEKASAKSEEKPKTRKKKE
jgi:trigger factor